jgi:hypothetical protein
MIARIVLIVLLAGLVAGCQAQPTVKVGRGDILLEESFSESYAWEAYRSEAQRVDFGVIDGAYRARVAGGGLMWGLNAQLHTDVMIEVETTQLSEFRDNGYGVMCRAAPSNNGDGYYFLISGDGMYTIRRGKVDQVTALIEWTPHGAIRQDRAINRIRIVCIGDYLALYVNDQFVAETRDDDFSEGFAGLAAAVSEEGDADIAFDDLTIWKAGIIP